MAVVHWNALGDHFCSMVLFSPHEEMSHNFSSEFTFI